MTGKNNTRFPSRLLALWLMALLMALLVVGTVWSTLVSGATSPSADARRALSPSSAGSSSAPGAGTSTRSGTKGISGPIVIREVKHDLSPAFRDIPPVPPQPRTEREMERHRVGAKASTGVQDTDRVVQRTFGALVPTIPTPSVLFAGINQAASGCVCYPPDPNGDVGPNDYVQTVNLSFAVYNKTGGAPRFGPVAINTLWSGFGGPCQSHNDGDPIVKYDQLADRWLITQFTSHEFFYECIAVSQTSDPTGAYYRYAFPDHDPAYTLGDYPKIGVWPDGYYMSTNEFDSTDDSYVGAGNYAYDRTRMLLGLSATAIYFNLPVSDWGGQQPSDLDGTTLPPIGAPNLFVEVDDSAWDPANIPTDQIQMWRFHADFTLPNLSTFTALPPITPPQLQPFDGMLCNFSPCVPQPGTGQKLDAIPGDVMYRVAYRNFGDHESIVFNHTVDAGTDKAAVRWYELRGISAVPTIYQQGTYDPDTDQHWMASAAMDSQGDIALGYSVSSSTTYPSARYTGRLAADTLGQLPQGEGVIVNGAGSQTGSYGRWGDYTSLTVDPTDDCTFWYTNEYYPATSGLGWYTHIGAFKFANCTAPAQASPTATPNNTATMTPAGTASATPTSAASSTSTTTSIASPTLTQTTQPASTNTSTVTRTATRTATPNVSATACAVKFADVPPTGDGSTFYGFVRCLACRHIVSGYQCGGPGEPCDPDHDQYYRPNSNVTRGQLSKIIALSAGLSYVVPTGRQSFHDVVAGDPFYTYIEQLAQTGAITGYPCNSTDPQNGEFLPCDAQNHPWFRPNNLATRGQISKIVSIAAGYNENIPSNRQSFTDVPHNSPFWVYIERLAARNVINGYNDAGHCGANGSPCFRYNDNTTRGQMAKIAANAFFPNCQTPAKP